MGTPKRPQNSHLASHSKPGYSKGDLLADKTGHLSIADHDCPAKEVQYQPAQHLYITDPIRPVNEGEWFWHRFCKKAFKATRADIDTMKYLSGHTNRGLNDVPNKYWEAINASTDTSLHNNPVYPKHRVYPISPEFLHEFAELQGKGKIYSHIVGECTGHHCGPLKGSVLFDESVCSSCYSYGLTGGKQEFWFRGKTHNLKHELLSIEPEPEIWKVQFKQTDGHNCAVYALANVLNEETMLAHIGHGADEPHRIYDQNEILRKEKKNYHIECVWRDIIKNKLPSYFELYPMEKEHVSPMLMVVSGETDEIRHCVGIHAYPDKSVHILDSLKDEIIATWWSDIHKYYPLVHGIYVFVNNDNSGYMMMSHV